MTSFKSSYSYIVLQLGSSGTSYNVTLNLTGHILMGLGIATSLLLYMFLNGMDNAGYGYGHQSSGYNSYDRALRTKVKRIYKHHILVCEQWIL